jgi:protein phosphatase
VASNQAAEIFLRELQTRLPTVGADGLHDLLYDVTAQANKAVYEHSLSDEECRGMGTTTVAAIVLGENVAVLNVGDSRCYLVDDQSITQVTRDHSLVNDLVMRGELTPEEARRHPGRNLITRALGVEETVKPDLYPLQRKDGSYLLLCSDGLSNTVTDPEIQYEVIHGGDPEDCCQRLLEIALNRGAPDNVTAVLVQL